MHYYWKQKLYSLEKKYFLEEFCGIIAAIIESPEKNNGD